ncbi:hypothetical protein [Acidaminobacter sp.]|uniref:hypothetical protein n=1 Tax=Acidaminobacter sp. TaxID=1872102 RepID=UPI00137C8328|nr:hypothetical protein [Acidaminobacter sp.]MDK9711511.1 hypothetical protein [Acidaminobacter sp.]MZQ96234.1 hypothetical protein [Acidaminobacter sp.]
MQTSKNLKKLLPMVTLTLLLTAAATLSACAPAVEPPATPPAAETPAAPTLPQAQEKIFEQAGSDPWRDYSFEPASLQTWINEEGDEILDVWVRIDYKNNPGTAVRDEQQWHIDFKNNRYKVSDSFAYDAEGNFCET